MVSFGNPLFLTGILTIGIPVYLHLYYRKNPVPRDFPSLRLIRLSMEAMVRRLQLKNLLLLALRILVLFFLTLALAKPFWGGGNGAAAATGAPSAFVVVLDNSLSMGASYQGISLFNAAKAKALEILDRMGPYDKASVALLNDPGRLLFPQLTWDKGELKESVRNVPLSMSGTNLFSSLQSGLKLLANVRSYKRSLYLITDLTANSWKTFLDTYDLKGIDKDIDLVLVPIGNMEPPNLTLTEMNLVAPIVLKGKPAPLAVTVANYSNRPQKSRLSVVVDGDKKHEQPVELKPQERKRLTFPLSFPREGFSHVSASLTGDALPQDDTRHLAVKVLAPQRVLIVKPPPDRQGRDSREDLFLKFSLNPMARREGSTFQVESRSIDNQAELAQIDPAAFAIVFLVNQRNLSDEFTSKLIKYVMSGGNLVIFMGSRVDPTWYNLHLIDKPGNDFLLPARLMKRVGNSVSKVEAYRMTDLDFGHPAFRLFSQEGSGDPGRAQIYEYYQVEANRSAMILARLSHGLPAVLEEKRGQGRVVLVTFSADTDWTNWPLKPTFLPFLQQTALGMISKQGPTNEAILPGTPVSMLLKEEGLTHVRLTLPSGKTLELPVRREATGFMNFSTTETDEAGFYRLDLERASGTRSEAFTVNFPPEEGNLERIEPSKIPRFILVNQKPGSKETLGEKIAMVREGRDFTIPLLWALILIAIVETFLANFSLSKVSRI